MKWTPRCCCLVCGSAGLSYPCLQSGTFAHWGGARPISATWIPSLLGTTAFKALRVKHIMKILDSHCKKKKKTKSHMLSRCTHTHTHTPWTPSPQLLLQNYHSVKKKNHLTIGFSPSLARARCCPPPPRTQQNPRRDLENSLGPPLPPPPPFPSPGIELRYYQGSQMPLPTQEGR